MNQRDAMRMMYLHTLSVIVDTFMTPAEEKIRETVDKAANDN